MRSFNHRKLLILKPCDVVLQMTKGGVDVSRHPAKPVRRNRKTGVSGRRGPEWRETGREPIK